MSAQPLPGTPDGWDGIDAQLLDEVRRSVLAQNGPVTDLQVAAAVRESGRLLGTAGSLVAMERISAELNGLGPLQGLVKDPAVTDIFVNAPDSVWQDRGGGPERVAVRFAGEAELRALAVRLVASGGRRLDDSSPCVDVKIHGGYRVHAVLPPISSAGTLLSIRIKRRTSLSLADMVADGSLDRQMARVLAAIIAGRLNFLISGATGAGKTTLLSTLLALCPATERLVLIEDAAELEPVHPHVVTLEARHENAEGAGTVELAELVRQALRMNPGRLIVGECRGSEVRELLMAMNTGHSGGGGTIHANGTHDVPARLAALGALAGMGPEAVFLQGASALDVVIHLARVGGRRTVAEIAVVGLRDGRLVATPALTLCGPAGSPLGDDGGPLPGGEGTGGGVQSGPGWQLLAARLGMDTASLAGVRGGIVDRP
ncbi:pilus assembly protein CpaF [Arthrobacter stackebrandtii]|uniref:Pilus assembly protein CpaF n=1 Tax=Arthrobacter stackebrandtii TaxID=272161 RepID=A0ABS4YUD8_9MICC|nr:TadA family conjugal transfer-associated ATPase [Arthrobacter stackebrandtii]MBP2412403.1 pilus assembly protein CpaF [Arthrobacter stackebrandtii]PYH02172.1 secretion system protein E [Arthrobacter stackebrandtii]